MEAAHAGDDALLDAEGATLILRPEPEVIQVYDRALAARSVRAAALAAYRDHAGGHHGRHADQLMLNVGLALELDQLERTGADGIGLYRTEMRHWRRAASPTWRARRRNMAACWTAPQGRRVQFRTLDLGADKLLPGRVRPGRGKPGDGLALAARRAGPPGDAAPAVARAAAGRAGAAALA